MNTMWKVVLISALTTLILAGPACFYSWRFLLSWELGWIK